MHSTTAASAAGSLTQIAHYLESRVLASGRLPTNSLLSPARAAIGTTPGKLRLVFTSERAGLNTPALSSKDLSDLRIYTQARIVYALTAAPVAGAVAQTNMYDYRIGNSTSKHSHFGVPLSSVEVKVKDTAALKTTEEQAVGELVVTGSSVAGGEAALGFNARFGEDHTVAYV